jgi:hypothetical protein
MEEWSMDTQNEEKFPEWRGGLRRHLGGGRAGATRAPEAMVKQWRHEPSLAGGAAVDHHSVEEADGNGNDTVDDTVYRQPPQPRT